MARPREFDTNDALERVMQVFWAKGYDKTSLDDLCAATNLNRSSLYAAFGNKRKLFFDALERYAEYAVARNSAALARPVPLRQALAEFLDHFVDQAVAGPERRGCFIGNCALEMARRDRQGAAWVKKNFARVEASYRDAFERARGRGEIAATADTEALAHFFMASFQGLRLVGKINPDRQVLSDIAKTIMKCLEPEFVAGPRAVAVG